MRRARRSTRLVAFPGALRLRTLHGGTAPIRSPLRAEAELARAINERQHLGHADEEVDRDHFADLHLGRESTGERLVLDDGHVVIPRQLLDVLSDLVEALGGDDRRPLGGAITERNRDVSRVGDDDGSFFDALSNAPAQVLPSTRPLTSFDLRA